jgi:hypothetical protein
MIAPACVLAFAIFAQAPDRPVAIGPEKSSALDSSSFKIHPRERSIFKEWAKDIRESLDASKRIPIRNPAKRDAWAVKSAKSKEDKIRKHYRLDLYRLFLIVKRGVDERWPTEIPGDRSIVEPIVAQRQAFLDSTIFEEELNAWVKAHLPSSAGTTTSLLGLGQSVQRRVFEVKELRKEAPITVCGSRLQDGSQCPRKVVGNPGRHCYEHRTPNDGLDDRYCLKAGEV